MTDEAKVAFWELEVKLFGGIKTNLERKIIVDSEIYELDKKLKECFDLSIKPGLEWIIKTKFDELKSNEKVKEWLRSNFPELKNNDESFKDFRTAINEFYTKYKIR